jgi:hypothetical protein
MAIFTIIRFEILTRKYPIEGPNKKIAKFCLFVIQSTPWYTLLREYSWHYVKIYLVSNNYFHNFLKTIKTISTALVSYLDRKTFLLHWEGNNSYLLCCLEPKRQSVFNYFHFFVGIPLHYHSRKLLKFWLLANINDFKRQI